jgi:hypothetical protein
MIVSNAVKTNQLTDLFLEQIQYNDASLVAALLAAGADVHFDDDDPIFIAAEYAAVDVAKVLIDAGANVNVYYEAPLHVAIQNADQQMIDLLIQAGADVEIAQRHSDLSRAFNEAERIAYLHDFQITQILGDTSIDYFARATNSLLKAVTNPWSDHRVRGGTHEKMIESFLRAGADVHAHNDQALRLARRYGHDRIVKILENWIEEHG